ncbi:carboxypeptidase-like regulatory domain-containing protein [Dysgonomonas sp. 511]|uniref:carboxypeptidase-like regulatory domain-containing protein n=1 Tax=Dysgonomonas sp. 511 TaxID=2302930 RepID=UPI0013D87986|nr:carboxypeptidase-like regulatory domain-containing protein [Dysgonomonas sp. 511]
MKSIVFIIFLCVGTIPIIAQNTVLEKRISVSLNAMPMEKAIEKIAATAGIHVSYSSDLFSHCSPVTLAAQDQMLLAVLNKLFAPYKKIAYTVHAGQLILFPKKTIIVKEYTIKGTICHETSGSPISYATLQIKGKPKGVVADHNGFFEFTLSELELADSLTASCLGYERRTFGTDTLLAKPEVRIALKEKPLNIESVIVTATKLPKKSKTLGNRNIFTTGSIYLDTHGQQIALYIENKKHLNGYIRKVSYHLSNKGNVEAPFRVRIFDVDTLTNAPGKDILPEILVIQPPQDTNGWFDVNLSEYQIFVPPNGFFVAIQGVFPNDYSFYANDSELVDTGKLRRRSNDDFAPKSIHYGQRINYSGKGGGNTWHYSLSHQWFQMERDNYSVKISAEIGIFSKK